jgi:hypothetical protein
MSPVRKNVRGPSVSTASTKAADDARFRALTVRQRMAKALALGRRGRAIRALVRSNAAELLLESRE